MGYHDFDGIVLKNDEQEKIIEALGNSNHTLLMRNHGLITAGPTAAWAFIRHQHFVRNTEVQLKLMASNAEVLIVGMLHSRIARQLEF